jgi:hypothetical protein
MSQIDQSNEQDLDTGRALARMVDLRIPLPWLLGGVGAFLWVVISMWFSLAQIKSDMGDLKTAIATTTATAGKMQLLEFRLQTVEADIARLNSARSK